MLRPAEVLYAAWSAFASGRKMGLRLTRSGLVDHSAEGVFRVAGRQLSKSLSRIRNVTAAAMAPVHTVGGPVWC